jgi:hypothetical protein
MQTILTPLANLSYDIAENILFIKMHEGAEMNLFNTKVHFSLINNMVGNKKYLALIDSMNYYSIERDAWKYASTENVLSNRKAAAHINTCIPNRLTLSYFTHTYNSLIPIEFFKTKEEAEKWLKSFP